MEKTSLKFRKFTNKEDLNRLIEDSKMSTGDISFVDENKTLYIANNIIKDKEIEGKGNTETKLIKYRSYNGRGYTWTSGIMPVNKIFHNKNIWLPMNPTNGYKIGIYAGQGIRLPVLRYVHAHNLNTDNPYNVNTPIKVMDHTILLTDGNCMYPIHVPDIIMNYGLTTEEPLNIHNWDKYDSATQDVYVYIYNPNNTLQVTGCYDNKYSYIKSLNKINNNREFDIKMTPFISVNYIGYYWMSAPSQGYLEYNNYTWKFHPYNGLIVHRNKYIIYDRYNYILPKIEIPKYYNVNRWDKLYAFITSLLSIVKGSNTNDVALFIKFRSKKHNTYRQYDDIGFYKSNGWKRINEFYKYDLKDISDIEYMQLLQKFLSVGDNLFGLILLEDFLRKLNTSNDPYFIRSGNKLLNKYIYRKYYFKYIEEKQDIIKQYKNIYFKCKIARKDGTLIDPNLQFNIVVKAHYIYIYNNRE